MDYSAATAPLAFGKALFTLPHMLIGLGMLVAASKKKAGPILGVGGLLFVLVVVYVWVTDASLALQCHKAAIAGTGVQVSGRVSGVEQRYSRSGQSAVHFKVGETAVTTWTSGLNNDCGFIESVGRTYRPVEGQSVEGLLFRGQLIRLAVN